VEKGTDVGRAEVVKPADAPRGFSKDTRTAHVGQKKTRGGEKEEAKGSPGKKDGQLDNGDRTRSLTTERGKNRPSEEIWIVCWRSQRGRGGVHQ